MAAPTTPQRCLTVAWSANYKSVRPPATSDRPSGVGNLNFRGFTDCLARHLSCPTVVTEVTPMRVVLGVCVVSLLVSWAPVQCQRRLPQEAKQSACPLEATFRPRSTRHSPATRCSSHREELQGQFRAGSEVRHHVHYRADRNQRNRLTRGRCAPHARGRRPARPNSVVQHHESTADAAGGASLAHPVGAVWSQRQGLRRHHRVGRRQRRTE